MKKRGMLAITVCLSLALTACAGQAARNAPELIEPAKIRFDTEKVTRQTISVRDQYRAAVRNKTAELFFKETEMKLGSMNVYAGQRVKAGDVLAELDAEDVNEQIETQREYIEFMAKSNAHDNTQKGYDLEIAQLELEELLLTPALNKDGIESKNEDVSRLRLELAHSRESQELEMAWQDKKLKDLEKKLEETKLLAPFDGNVVYAEEIVIGGKVKPYKPIIYIAQDDALYVEYSGTDSLLINEQDRVQGNINGKSYEMQYQSLTREETLSYIFEGKTPPMRFSFAAIDADVKAGQFVSLLVTRSEKADVLTIPINSLFTSTEIGNYVYLIRDGQKVLTTVEVGIKNQSEVEITEGLREGDEVFVKQ